MRQGTLTESVSPENSSLTYYIYVLSQLTHTPDLVTKGHLLMVCTH